MYWLIKFSSENSDKCSRGIFNIIKHPHSLGKFLWRLLKMMSYTFNKKPSIQCPDLIYCTIGELDFLDFGLTILILHLPLYPFQPLAQGPKTKYIRQECKQNTPRCTWTGATWTSGYRATSLSCSLWILCCRSKFYQLDHLCHLLNRFIIRRTS